MAGILTGFSLFAVSDADFNRRLGVHRLNTSVETASNKFDA